jgi:hypothetical protein
MPRRPLSPVRRPRVLALDFSAADVSRLQAAGLNVVRGQTGVRKEDTGISKLPCAAQDIEIILVRVSTGTFTNPTTRGGADSLANFQNYVHETTAKGGWVVFFIEKSASAAELRRLEFDLGVYEQRGVYKTPTSQTLASQMLLPEFRGDVVNTSDSLEAEILYKYIRNCPTLRILACERRSMLSWSVDWPLSTDNTPPLPLALLYRKQSLSEGPPQQVHARGTIIFAPDFGDKTVDVALELIRQCAATTNPELFDTIDHPWLSDYLPRPARVIRERRVALERQLAAEIAALKQEEAIRATEFQWLTDLLTTKGDELVECVSKALQILGFGVALIDDTVDATARKKEDLHVSDGTYFAIAEVKGTERGAAEDFISQLERHQLQYSRDKALPAPTGLLIVNHSLRIEPTQRRGRFYNDVEIATRLAASGITSIETVALYAICQRVLAGALSPEGARDLVKTGGPIVRMDSYVDANGGIP